MEILQILISAFVTIFSMGLLCVSIASYKKYKSIKLFFVSLVFLVFFIHGVLLSMSLFFPREFSFLSTLITNGVFDLMILLFLFVATLKR